MMFENDLLQEPTIRSQVIRHLPLVLLVGGVLAALFALHTAVVGVVVVAGAHVALGIVIFAVRRHRSSGDVAAGAR